MKAEKQEIRQERILYALVWSVVFLAVPVTRIFLWLNGKGDASIWQGTWPLWLRILPFFLLFLVHDLFLSPLLVRRKKTLAYLFLTAVVFSLFCVSVVHSVFFPGGPGRSGDAGRPGGGPGTEWAAPDKRPSHPQHDHPAPPPHNHAAPSARGLTAPLSRPPMRPETMRILVGLLMLGVNLGVKYYFQSVREEQRVRKLELENLNQQLEALRYQINPHFFMNTLNNIHALVDLDPEKARESILELSKMMRYILYEGNRPTIPLSQEAEFLRHYVSLMRIRYPEDVRIDLSLPEVCGDAEVPPLVFASSVENAFKHGISYEAESFVSIDVACRDGRVVFRCSNSRHGAATGGGIGMDNVRKRLELLYDEDFIYSVEATESRYDILMNLPASPGNRTAAV